MMKKNQLQQKNDKIYYTLKNKKINDTNKKQLLHNNNMKFTQLQNKQNEWVSPKEVTIKI